jgi:small subunit ribosomal protein S8
MTIQDPISDMLTRIRNGQQAKLQEVVMPASKMKEAIAKLLKEEGYITDYLVEAQDHKKQLKIMLKYHQGKPVISSIRRVSKSGLRVYKRCDELPQVLGGLGIAIVSTPKGIMTDHAARASKHGGEIICYIE